MRHGDGEIASPDISVGAVNSRYWMLRVDERGGGVRAASAGAQQAINVSGAQALAQQELGGASRRLPVIDWKRWSLWGGLLLEVVILIAMAWRLVRQIRHDAENRKRAP